MIIFGKINLGRVDEVAHTCVMTNFFMLFFVPLIPLRSFYATSNSRFTEAEPMMPCEGLSGKSVLIAYVRALTLLAVLAVAVMALTDFVYFTVPVFFIKPGRSALIVLTGIGASLAGLTTYAFERSRDSDARDVREVAARVLGVAVDPRRVSYDVMKTLRGKLDEELRAKGFSAAEDVVENSDADLRANGVALLRLWTESSSEAERLCQVLLVRLRESGLAAGFDNES